MQRHHKDYLGELTRTDLSGFGFLESEDRHLIISKKKKDNHRCGSIPEEGKMDRLMPGSSRLEGPGSSKLEEAKKKKKKKQPFPDLTDSN